ncbi:hypothetical protein GQ600_7769 [Phytophthora cactorum]|nr:hypothetical protein GQ600_7769 [Phytophthora cactorum]
MMAALETAAANGHSCIVLRSRDGRNDVVGLLLNNHEFSNDSILIALDEGARNDHCDVAKLLLGQFTDDETDDAAEGILAGGHIY